MRTKQITKRIISWVMTAALMLGMIRLPQFALTARADGTLTGDGSTANPYQIGTVADWETFAGWISAGTNAGQYYRLTADVEGITTMAGTDSEDHEFKGTFDGGGHTLSVTLTTDGSNFIAPFRRVNGATIKNLHTAGTVSTGEQRFGSGLVGHSYGDVIISNCRSSVAITSDLSNLDDKDATHGGFVGVVDGGTVTINNCLFDGSISDSSATNCGGFMGWHREDLQVTFNSCLMAGTMSVNIDSNSATFNRNGDKKSTHNNCYYVTSYGAVQGTLVGEGSNTETAEKLAAAFNNAGTEWQVVEENNVVPIMVKDPKNIQYATIRGINSGYSYTGAGISITPVVTAADYTELTLGSDFTATLNGDTVSAFPFTVTEQSNYTLTITGTGEYSGSLSRDFRVPPSHGLGTRAITNPIAPGADGDTDGWTGSYVYYGKYDGTNPTKYRVLDRASKEFHISGGSLLLDCDSILYTKRFRVVYNADNANQWLYSDVKDDLNRDGFLNRTNNSNANFTAAEKAAIAPNGKRVFAAGDGHGFFTLNWTPLGEYDAGRTADYIFLLDAMEATSTSYGYADTYEPDSNKIKSGAHTCWWLRSPYKDDSSRAGCVMYDGRLSYDDFIVNTDVGVSPAFNVKLSSVIFSSKIAGTLGEPGAEYKLTILDSDMGIAVTENKSVVCSGNTITVPYTISGSNRENATQVSVLITNVERTAEDAEMLQYGSLTVDGALGTSGTGTFEIDDSRVTGTLGEDYHVYILAEDVNGEKETDYASEPIEITTILQSVDVPQAATEPEFRNHSVVLGGQIGVNFYMELPEIEGYDYAGSYMEFTLNGKTSRMTYENSFVDQNTGYRRFTCYLNSLQMADEIEAVFHYNNTETGINRYSVKTYVDYITSHENQYTPVEVALVKSIANYGHYTQPFIANYSNWTDGYDHETMPAASEIDNDAISAARTAVADKAIVKELGGSGLSEVQYSLSFGSETYINLYLKPEDGVTIQSVSCVDANDAGKPVTTTMSGEYSKATINKINALDLGNQFTFTVVTSAGTATVKVYPLSYAYAFLNADSYQDKTDVLQAMTALYQYYEATYNYVNAN